MEQPGVDISHLISAVECRYGRPNQPPGRGAGALASIELMLINPPQLNKGASKREQLMEFHARNDKIHQEAWSRTQQG